MIERSARAEVEHLLEHRPAVAILGPRQVGKTTLAKAICSERGGLYLDLKTPSHLARLDDAEQFLRGHLDKLVVLDEVHRKPDLFAVLRGLIDEARAAGSRTGRYLILGSASPDLLRQSSESLAGRLAFVEMTPLTVVEAEDSERLWVRGGFPDSFLAGDDSLSLKWRRDFIRTYVERDIPQIGPRVSSQVISRFWTMLAHGQGALWNGARIAGSLGVTGPTAARYLDLMTDLLLVRQLPPYLANVRKRLVKSPKVYVRDSGIVHALLELRDRDVLLGHPVVGASWEGFVVEQLLAACPEGVECGFYRTARGDELDLVVKHPSLGMVGIEIKRTGSPRLESGNYQALDDLGCDRAICVYSGNETFPLKGGVNAMAVLDACRLLSAR